MKRNKVFQIRISQREIDFLNYLSRSRKATRSEVIRQAIFNVWSDEKAIKETEDFHKKKAIKKGGKANDKRYPTL